MYSVRFRFRKFGPAAFISHLDLMRTIQRSLKRSGLPIYYSQGFNPHIFISILAPISTGYESECELFDIELLGDSCPENVLECMNKALPQGLEVTECFQSNRPLKDIEFATYGIFYPLGSAEVMGEYFTKPITITKESKRQSKEVNVQDYIKNITFEQVGKGVVCTCVLNLGNDQLNPIYITEALRVGGLWYETISPQYKRIALLDKNFQIFK